MKKIYFKKLKNLTLFFKFLPKRVLNFKRPKWKKLQLLLNKKNKKLIKKKLKNKKWKKVIKKTSLIDHIKKKKMSFFWEKKKKAYKTGLLLKNSFEFFFGNSYKKKYIKKNIKEFTKKAKFFYLLKFLLRFDILLWKLNLVKSSRVAKNLIRKGFFTINNTKKLNPNYVVKYHDIVSCKIDQKEFCFTRIKRILPIEIDYYTNSFVLPSKIITKDLAFIFNEYIPIRRISSFIIKK